MTYATSPEIAFVRRMILERGGTQAGLAKTLGVSPNAMSAWLNGKRPMPRYVIAYVQADERYRRQKTELAAVLVGWLRKVSPSALDDRVPDSFGVDVPGFDD